MSSLPRVKTTYLLVPIGRRLEEQYALWPWTLEQGRKYAHAPVVAAIVLPRRGEVKGFGRPDQPGPPSDATNGARLRQLLNVWSVPLADEVAMMSI